MKTKFITIIFQIAFAMLLTSSVQAKANKAIVRSVRDGKAQISNDSGKTWSRAKVGSVLSANSIIKTDAKASVDLFLGHNGPVVRVTKGSELKIDRLDIEDTGVENIIGTQLDLKKGRILGIVKKLAAASKYEVTTPVGVAGIPGTLLTEYSIDADGTVKIPSGMAVVVYVHSSGPPPLTIQAGNQSIPPGSNGAPAQVIPGTFERLIEVDPPFDYWPPMDLSIKPLPESIANFDSGSGLMNSPLVMVMELRIKARGAAPNSGGHDVTETPLTEVDPGD